MYFIYTDLKKFFSNPEAREFLHSVKGKVNRIKIESDEPRKTNEKERYYPQDMILTYDTSNQLIHLWSERDTGRVDDRITRAGYEVDFIYDQDKLREKIIRSFTIDLKSDFQPSIFNTRKYHYTYDERGNLIRTKGENSHSNILYDAKGRISGTASYYEHVKNGYAEFEYDEQDRVIKISDYGHFMDESSNNVDENGDFEEKPIIRLRGVQHFEYQQLNDNLYTCTIRKFDVQWDSKTIEIFTYDNELKIVTWNQHNDKGELRTERLYEYEYDEQGNVVYLTITTTNYFKEGKGGSTYSNYKRTIEYA